MDRFETEAARVQLQAENQELAALRRAYTESLRDVKIKIIKLKGRRATPGTAQSIQYQLSYAYQQENELTEILKRLNSNVVASAQEYLQASYESGFYGTAYTLHGKGIPVAIGVDQRAMAEAVQLRIGGLKFSERLYSENLQELKTRYLSTLARGLGGGWSFEQIAAQLSSDTGISLRRAYTIARTEGSRVYETARQHGMEQAKAKGADIVKQWSAVLDLKTRPSHQRLDGQIREIEEPYEIDGMKAMHPLEFGIAAMDVNCRCKSLERARWAVEAEQAGEGAARTKWDGEAGKIAPYQPYSKWFEGYRAEHPEYMIQAHEEKEPASAQEAKTAAQPEKPLNSMVSGLKNGAKNAIIKLTGPLPGESDIVNLAKERGIGFDANGKQVLTKDGTENYVNFTHSEFERVRGGILTHNHPNGMSFSGEDIYLIKYGNLKQIRAVTKSGIYYMGPPAKWDDSLKSLGDIKAARNKIELEIRDDPEGIYKAKKASIKSMREWHEFLHAETNRKFAEKYGLTYGRIDWE